MGHLFDGRSRLAASALGLDRYEGVPAHGVLEHTATVLPNREAICYGDDHWSFAALDHDARRCAAMLQRLGVKRGDRVGILLPNVPEYVIAVNGIWRAGGTVVAINPMMVPKEADRLLKMTDCRLVVCLDLLSHLVTSANTNAQMLLVSIRQHLPALQQLGYLWKRHSQTGYWTLPTSDRCRWFWNEIGRTTGDYKPVSMDPVHDAAYILPTGGTTGTPNAVVLSHQNMVANAWQQFEWTHRSFGVEKMLAVMPFFHSYGISATVMGGAMMGATLILHHRFNVAQVIRLIKQHRPTVFHAVPAMLVALNERLRSYPADMRSIRWVISGGAPLPASVGSEFAAHSGALVVEGFGLSEASPVTHVGDLFGEPKYGTIGLPLPETRCRIVDIHDGIRDVIPGTVGELIIKGPQVMLGYWNDEVGTAQAVRGGWLYTGDLATLEPDGCYRIVGRKKDLIITSGFNVYPSEVESALREHPDVLDAAIVGQPDSQRGEIVKAFVVLRAGAVWDEASLHKHCLLNLSKYKCPRVFEQYVGDLPRNFLGKVIHRELRDRDSTSIRAA